MVRAAIHVIANKDTSSSESASSHLGRDMPLLFSRARSRSRLRSWSRVLNVDRLSGLPDVHSVRSLLEDPEAPRAAWRARVGDASGVSEPAVDRLTSAISASGVGDGWRGGNARSGEKLVGGVHVVGGLVNENEVLLLFGVPNVQPDVLPIFEGDEDPNVGDTNCGSMILCM